MTGASVQGELPRSLWGGEENNTEKKIQKQSTQQYVFPYYLVALYGVNKNKALISGSEF